MKTAFLVICGVCLALMPACTAPQKLGKAVASATTFAPKKIVLPQPADTTISRTLEEDFLPFDIGSAVCKVVEVRKGTVLVEDSRGVQAEAVIPRGPEVVLGKGDLVRVAVQISTPERKGTFSVAKFDLPPVFRNKEFPDAVMSPLAVTAEEKKNLPGFYARK